MKIEFSQTMTSPIVEGASGAGGSAGGLVDRFNRLMETAPLPPSTGSGMPQALGQFVQEQQSMYTQIGEKALAFSRNAESMTMEQMALHHIELVQAVGQAQTQFTAATALAQGAKSGLQTLIKNQ